MKKLTEFEKLLIEADEYPREHFLTSMEISIIDEIFCLSSIIHGDYKYTYDENGNRYRITETGVAQAQMRFDYLVKIISRDPKAIEKMDVYNNTLSSIRGAVIPRSQKGDLKLS